ncbi:MAG: tetratricopeptide repeat protein [Cellvibrionaceae bacterium]
MPDMIPLDAKTQENIKKLCFEGYQSYDRGEYSAALRTFYQAWILLPRPQTDFAEAGWVLAAIGDTYFKAGQYKQAIEALNSALACPRAENSPFIHLRIGQSLYESGDRSGAKAYLAKAVELGGNDALRNEDYKYKIALHEDY